MVPEESGNSGDRQNQGINLYVVVEKPWENDEKKYFFFLKIACLYWRPF